MFKQMLLKMLNNQFNWDDPVLAGRCLLSRLLWPGPLGLLATRSRS